MWRLSILVRMYREGTRDENKALFNFSQLGQSITQLKHFEVKEKKKRRGEGEKKGEVTVVFISSITRSAICQI